MDRTSRDSIDLLAEAWDLSVPATVGALVVMAAPAITTFALLAIGNVTGMFLATAATAGITCTFTAWRASCASR